MRKSLILALALYGAAAIVTFGHSAAYAAREHAACEARPLRSNQEYRWCENVAPMAGMVSAFLWPLYWSWEAWS